MKELEIKIFGRVQGVNFRRRMARVAKNLRIKGFVENLEDGSVHAVAQGEEGALEELLSWSQKGYFPAKVTGMQFEWKDIEKNKYKEFKVETGPSLIEDEASSITNLGRSILNEPKISVPKHVVIIPDGNRRWARERGWKAYVGHRRGAQTKRIVQLFEDCHSVGVEYLTLWGFSTENWDREDREVQEIFNIVKKSGDDLKKLMKKYQIRFTHLGRKDRLPDDVMTVLRDLEESTKDFDKMHFQLCLDYGGRRSIVEAVNRLISRGVKEIDEDMLAKTLESNHLPDPDLIIRTSGEKRTSGIMPFESVYAELYFTDVYFPDFDSEQFMRAILDYSGRKRRFGGTHTSDVNNELENELIDPDDEETSNLNLH